MTESESESTAESAFHFIRAPWWKWNLLTLAGGLFVIAWTREILRFSPRPTFAVVFLFVTLWYAAPSLVSRRPPWPLASVAPFFLMLSKMPRSLFVRAVACRIAAGVLLVAAALSSFSALSQWAMLVIRSGAAFGGSQTWLFLMQQLVTGAIFLAGAIGLWALAGVCSTVDELRAELKKPQSD